MFTDKRVQLSCSNLQTEGLFVVARVWWALGHNVDTMPRGRCSWIVRDVRRGSFLYQLDHFSRAPASAGAPPYDLALGFQFLESRLQDGRLDVAREHGIVEIRAAASASNLGEVIHDALLGCEFLFPDRTQCP